MSIHEGLTCVVIARNEVRHIKQTLDAVCRIASERERAEVIFVDSTSSDGTWEAACSIESPRLRCVRITKNASSPAARNLGASLAKYPVIFFIDGDVVVEPSFVRQAMERVKDPAIGIVFGQLKECIYTHNYEALTQTVDDRWRITREESRAITGGIFLTRVTVWEQVGRFDERLKRTQDWDFSFRVNALYKILAIPVLMGTHHTVAYQDNKRVWEMARGGYAFYLGLLLRKYILDPSVLVKIVSRMRGMVWGVAFWGCMCLAIFHPWFVLGALCIFGLDLKKAVAKKQGRIIGRLLEHYVGVLLVLGGMIGYYPTPKEVAWEEHLSEVKHHA